uniref:Uncharacterized protein n=1 Tax=Syphacia muris TaxID=451379 RepID=A0A0N5AKT7_9BILA
MKMRQRTISHTSLLSSSCSSSGLDHGRNFVSATLTVAVTNAFTMDIMGIRLIKIDPQYYMALSQVRIKNFLPITKSSASHNPETRATAVDLQCNLAKLY